jgi:hypothetical protein
MQDVHYAIYLKGVLVASSGAVPPSCRTNPSGPVTIVLTTVPFNRIKPASATGPVTFSGVTADWNTKSVFGASHHVTPGNVGKLDGVLFLMYNDPTLVDGFKFTRLYNITGSGPDAEVHVMLKTKGGVGDLKNILNKVAAVSGDIVGGTVRVRDISKLQASSSVIRAEIAPRCHPLLDLARPAVKVDQVFNSSCLDGSGVLEGIVDTGIDWKHTDFQSLTPSQTPSGKSRIKFIWDMDLVPLAGETPGPMFSGSPLGVLYSRTQINTALAVNPSLVRSQDGYASGEGGHGTHVAGIIGSSSAQYRGMAPACDYGIVRLPDPKGDLGWSYDLIEAGVGAIFDRAGTQPAVVNLSLGDQTGAHDGTELIDQALDNYLVTGGTPIQKRAICIAAGNDGNVTTNPIHAEGKIPAGGTVIIPFLEAETGTVDVWLQGGASYSGVNVYQQDAGGWFYTTPLPFGTPDASGLWYQVTANVAPACNEMISPNVVANEVNSLNNDYHLQFTAGYAYVDNLWNPSGDVGNEALQQFFDG